MFVAWILGLKKIIYNHAGLTFYHGLLGWQCIMKILAMLLFVFNLLGCAILVGGEAQSDVYLSRDEASEIARKYVEENNFLWGEPTSIRVVYNTYVFSYLTPSEEVQKLSGRTLHVDKLTGAVSVPLRF
jgi:hypothetical protein